MKAFVTFQKKSEILTSNLLFAHLLFKLSIVQRIHNVTAVANILLLYIHFILIQSRIQYNKKFFCFLCIIILL